MTIQAVFFDMGGTIETFWHTRELRLAATPGLQQLFQSAGIVLHLSDKQLYQQVSVGLDRYHQWSLQSLEELTPQQVWREFIFPDIPVDQDRMDMIAEDLMQYIEMQYYHREMRPEMPAVLEAICDLGLKIGLISNVCSRGQVPANLDKYDLRRFFDPIVLSSEYGRRKPDPAIFHYAARLANVPTSACIYVGDRISRDILGAQRAGYHLAVQIPHGFEHGEKDDCATPDVIIHQMTELLDILRSELDGLADSFPKDGKSLAETRAILFDAGDILYFRPHLGRKLKEFLYQLGLAADELPSAEYEILKQKAFRGQINQDQYREAILRMYGVNRPDHLKRGKQILNEENNNVQFFDGVRDTLIALKKKGYLLGIVTDTANPVHVKLSWFERGGFGEVWDSIISSQEIGFRKPDPQIFRAALRQLGLSGEQAVFVGHKASELAGARAVGMKTIAFNYDNDAKADYCIENFTDLLTIPVVP